jgi:hypothetical protein
MLTSEFRKVFLPVVITVGILTVVTCLLTLTLYKGYSLDYDLEAWEVGREILDFLFPLFVVGPVCWTLYYERKDRFLMYTLPRVSQWRYLTAKLVVAAVCAFVILFIPYVLSAVVALYVKAPILPMIRPEGTTPFSHIYLNLFIDNPLGYALALSAWKGVIGALVMGLGFLLSMYVKNIFIVLTGPFVYSILENFIWAILRIPQYRLITSFEPTVLSEDAIIWWSTLVGPGVLILFTGLLWFYFAKIRRLRVYEV